jgi:spermidine/putrescine transport system substrate-binding protein
MSHAFDGWCNYGTAENPDVKFVVPKEGSDLWVDTMVILKKSKNLDNAQAFVNLILTPKNHVWVVENVDYKVPNKAAMESVDPALLAKFPNLTTSPDVLLKMQLMRNLDEKTMTAYGKAARDIVSAH